MSNDAIIRIVAALAAVGLLLGPAAARLVQKARATIAARAAAAGKAEVNARDLHVVLDLATRLKTAGCTDGVALCQQLIDVMLGNSKARK